MRRLEWLLGILMPTALLLLTSPALSDEPAFRQRAPIEVKRAASFIQLPLPMSVYTHAKQPELADLRIVDARGERVPFALLAPRSVTQTSDESYAATLYPLPKRPANDAAFQSPLQVTVRGDVIRVTRGAAPAAAAAAARSDAPSAGWLIDIGSTGAADAKARAASLRLQWSGPAEFSAAFDWESSDDLRSWRAGGSGQLMALATAGETLKQDLLPLGPPSDTPGRFVRLYWREGAQAPLLKSAQLLLARQREVALDTATTTNFKPLPAVADSPADTDAARALQVDLGGAMPLLDVTLQWPAGNQVTPLRVYARSAPGQPWRWVARGLVYRLERDGKVSSSLALPLGVSDRYLRFVPDERAAPLDPAQTTVVLRMRPPTLVFPMQGRAPYALLTGSPTATPGALPANTLIPSLEEERERFGRATLGAFAEVPEVARAAAAAAQLAAWRPRLLWAVLLVGVAGLGWMVWRLARTPKAGESTERVP